MVFLRRSAPCHGLDDIHQTFERLGIMLIIAALIVAAAILSLNETLPRLFDISVLSIVCFAIAIVLAVRLMLKRK